MAKQYYFFPLAQDPSKSFLLNPETNILLTSLEELKPIFNSNMAIDTGAANYIKESIESGEIPVILG